MALTPCTLLLEVFDAASIYDDNPDTVAWEVSTDPTHVHPWLLAPRNYAEQEIDTIRCTASIGTIEVGVIDVPEVVGNQSTGWMTARIHDLLGRRCRLSRFISESVGWQVIADGPAGPPHMDPSYSAYRWSIRDTREIERKLTVGTVGGTTGIIPRLPVHGFGQYTDEFGDHFLLTPAVEVPYNGVFRLTTLGTLDRIFGFIDLVNHYTPGPIPNVDDATLVLDKEGQDAVQLVEVQPDVWAARAVDVLWRPFMGAFPGQPWNIARPSTDTNFRQPVVITTSAIPPGETDAKIAVLNIYLFMAFEIPAQFAGLSDGDNVEFILRYRGPATEAYPYYVENPLGTVLKDLYDGKFAISDDSWAGGSVYDPSGLNASTQGFASKILYDPAALDSVRMPEHVLLRLTEVIADARAWAETALYAPSGWIPALDNAMQISPVQRGIPESVSNLLLLDADVTVPSPNWTTGERTVSQVLYTWKRYFIPPIDAGFEIKADGLAIREVGIDFTDPESEIRYGSVPEEYDASAFSARGTAEGLNVPGELETGSLMAQTAKFDVLDRFRAGVQSISVNARRLRIPNVRVGDWVPWDLMHLPDRLTGLRGSTAEAAQIVSMRDDDCVWRTLLLEESSLGGGQPGYVDPLVVLDDDASAGFVGLVVLADEESY